MNFHKTTAMLMVMAILGTTFLSGGCVTRSRRDYGYVDMGTPAQTTAVAYLPVNNGTVTLPNGQIVPAQPGAVYPASPQAYPMPAYPMQAYAGSNRMTYEHNTEEFDWNTIFHGINTATNTFLGVTAGVSLIDHMSHPAKYNRRYYRRH